MKTGFAPMSKDKTLKQFKGNCMINYQQVKDLIPKFYNYDDKSHKINFPKDLIPSSFSSYVYKNYMDGSSLYWILERRKFDYEYSQEIKSIETYSHNKTLSLNKIESHEKEWEKKIYEFYFPGEYDSHQSSKTTNYNIDKLDNAKVLTLKDACYIGLDENNNPRNYSFIKQGNTIIEINCNVDPKTLYNRNGINELTEKYWVIERLKYDYGQKNHIIASHFGMKPGDWSGIERKIDLYPNLQDEHERGWIQWVNYVYNYHKNKTSYIKNIQDKYNHNFKIISAMNTEQLLEVADVFPEKILMFTNPSYYSSIIFMLLTDLRDEGRIKYEDYIQLEEILKEIADIKTYEGTPVGCPNIDMTIIEKVLESYKDDSYIPCILSVIELMFENAIINRFKKDKLVQMVHGLSRLYPSKKESNVVLDGFDWLSVYDDRFGKLIAEIDQKIERVKTKYNLL